MKRNIEDVYNENRIYEPLGTNGAFGCPSCRYNCTSF